MENNRERPRATVGQWAEVVAQSWNRLAKGGRTPSAKEVAQEVGVWLAIDESMALGLIEGIETLVGYAQAPCPPTETVLEQERQSVRVALQSVRPVFQARVQPQMDQIDQQWPEAWCRGCGQRLESQGRRSRNWDSTRGEGELTRRYSWCKRCQQGRALAQERVGLSDSDYTPALEEVCTLMATTVPHGMAVGLVKQVLGIEISAKASQSMLQRRGEQVAEQQDQEAQEIKQDEETWGVRPSGGPAATTPPVEVAYLEMDGVIVPTRQEVASELPVGEGRGGKGRRYEVSGREVKNAVLYDGATCAQESESRGCLLARRLSRAWESGERLACWSGLNS